MCITSSPCELFLLKQVTCGDWGWFPLPNGSFEKNLSQWNGILQDNKAYSDTVPGHSNHQRYSKLQTCTQDTDITSSVPTSHTLYMHAYRHTIQAGG